VITLRPAAPEDLPFIYSTWLKGLYGGNSLFGLIPYPTYMAAYSNVLAGLIERNRAIVACLSEDPSVVVGYSVISPDEATVHWVYVRKAWRKLGVARSLVPRDARYITHLTKTGQSLMKKLPRAVFNPFRA
jgi:GNAT superfamily N-acetyltransferase